MSIVFSGGSFIGGSSVVLPQDVIGEHRREISVIIVIVFKSKFEFFIISFLSVK